MGEPLQSHDKRRNSPEVERLSLTKVQTIRQE